MFYAFGFETVAVVVGDLYFVDPQPAPGQEGAERGVRIEVRLLRRGELRGSVYSAQPIAVEDPLWRADLFESVAGEPGSFDRTHHHPRFAGWEPGRRHFEPAMSADPIAFVGERLRDLPALLDAAGVDASTVSELDVEGVRAAAPEVLDVTRRLLERVRAGELGGAPAGAGDTPGAGARVGWL